MNLKEFRQSKGITQETMARQLNITFSYYSQIERKAVNPSRAFMEKLKNRYSDANIDELFFAEQQQQNCFIEEV